jgi:hypothetical protein
MFQGEFAANGHDDRSRVPAALGELTPDCTEPVVAGMQPAAIAVTTRAPAQAAHVRLSLSARMWCPSKSRDWNTNEFGSGLLHLE